MTARGVEPREMNRARRWAYALKPASWPKLLVPSALGQSLGFALAGHFSWLALALGCAFTLADLAFIVLMNDWGDQRVDGIKREIFPDGCSPKTIPDGILSAREVLFGGLGAGALALVLSYLGVIWLMRPWQLWLALLCVGLFIGYTLPPFRLNYRGGGELLELVGVGFALPIWHIYAQAGTLSLDAMASLWGFACLAFGSAVASGLSDEVSDRAGGKRTIATALGNRVARRWVEIALAAGGVVWVATAACGPLPDISPVGQWVWRSAHIAAALVVGGYLYCAFRVSEEAQTNAFGAQKRYKKHLHRAIWRGTTVLAIGLVVGVML